VPELRAGRPAGQGVGARALALGLLVLAAPRARAGEILGEVDAMAGVGVTDNATYVAGPNKQRDELLAGTAAGRLRYRGPLWNHSIGYQATGNFYLEGIGPSGYSQTGAWQTTGIITPKWKLDLGASAGYAQTTVFNREDVSTVMPRVVPLGKTTYTSFSASQGLTYEPNPRRRFAEALMASRIHVLDSPPQASFPDSSLIGGSLRGEQQLSIDQVNADITGAYLNTFYPNGNGQAREWILLQALVGWRRDLNPQWSAEARIGAMGIFLLDGLRGIIAPAFQLNAAYKRERWFANASLQQTVTPNVWGGSAMISDILLVRAALPLTRSERYYFMGFGSYMYGRQATSAGSVHSFDNRTVGATLTARSEKRPFYAQLEYTFTDQVFYAGDGGNVPLRRQMLMLNVGGTLIFGKGQPSIFGGVL
jgi:hypothetical protein